MPLCELGIKCEQNNTLSVLELKIQQKSNKLIKNHKDKCLTINSDKYYEGKTKRVAMKTAPVIIGEQRVVNESLPENVTFESSFEGRVTR